MFPALSTSDRRILERLWRSGATSRVELARHVGLTKPAITQIVRRLTEHGLVTEQVLRRGARGQPARPVALSERAAISVGVNFSHTFVDVGFVDLMGHPLAIQRRECASPTAEAIATAAFGLIGEMCDDLQLPEADLLGIGFSVPGDFLNDGSLKAHAYFPDLWGRDLGRALGRKTDLAVFVENDGKACSIGELILGAGRTHRSFMVVHIGHGVGGGVVIGGRIHRGAMGNAGPLGAFWPLDKPRPSGQDLLETLNANGLDCRDFNDLETMSPDADQVVSSWIARTAAQLEDILPKVARFIDPEVVVLGGRLPPSILEAIVERVDLQKKYGETVADRDFHRPRLIASQLGARAGVIGAAMLPIHRYLLPQD